MLVASAAAALALTPLVQAADNEAQAKARQAMRAKMGEPQTQQSAAPAPKATEPAGMPTATSVVPRVQPVNPQDIERARAATREKIQSMDSRAAAVLTTPAAPAPADEAALEKARQAMRSKSAQIQPQPVYKRGELPPLERTPASISADKQQKLSELLQRYRAEEITPEDYHRERTKILSVP